MLLVAGFDFAVAATGLVTCGLGIAFKATVWGGSGGEGVLSVLVLDLGGGLGVLLPINPIALLN